MIVGSVCPLDALQKKNLQRSKFFDSFGDMITMIVSIIGTKLLHLTMKTNIMND